MKNGQFRHQIKSVFTKLDIFDETVQVKFSFLQDCRA